MGDEFDEWNCGIPLYNIYNIQLYINNNKLQYFMYGIGVFEHIFFKLCFFNRMICCKGIVINL